MPWRCDGVMFDYGRTLVTFEYPTEALLDVIREFRPRLEAELGAPAPAAETLLHDVLLPIEEVVGSWSENEVAYLDVYRAAWTRAGLNLSEGLMYEILDAEQLCWDRSVRLEPGAIALLEWLGSRGTRRGICSNAPFPPEMMRRQLKSHGLAEHLDAVVFSSDLGRRKPAPEVYLAALDAMGTRAEHTLFVGDRVREDYLGPTAVGMRAVIVTAHSKGSLPEGIPTVPTLADLRGLL